MKDCAKEVEIGMYSKMNNRLLAVNGRDSLALVFEWLQILGALLRAKGISWNRDTNAVRNIQYKRAFKLLNNDFFLKHKL